MPLYRYEALDAGGRQKSGLIEADGPAAARVKLRKEALFPTRVEPETVQASQARPARGGRRISLSELSAFTSQLATLIRSGMPLLQGLEALGAQAVNPRWRTTVAQVRDSVSQGSTLADALAPHAEFDKLYVSLVRAGETSGSLDGCLDSLAKMLASRAKLLRKIWGALAYPILMSVVGLGMLLLMLTFVLPQVTHLFDGLKQKLPLPTRVLLAVSGVVREHGFGLLLLLGAAAGGAAVALRKPELRLRWDRARLRLPLFGPLALKGSLARMSSALGTLVRGGVPLLQGLEISAAVANNKALEGCFLEAAESVRKGSTLAAPLSREPLMPPVAVQMLRVGEESGNLEPMLFQLAGLLEEEVEQSVATLTSLLEPLLILTMGLAIGFLVLAILMPIFQLNQASFG